MKPRLGSAPSRSLAGCAAIVALNCSGPRQDTETHAPDASGLKLPKCACEDCTESVEVHSANHTNAQLTYDDDAPAGGDHSPCWGTWGMHIAPLAPERFVHNLEHGGVALLFNCADGCPQEEEWIRRFVAANELAIATPYPAMRHRFAAVAWGVRLQADCLDTDAVVAFYSEHVNQGPERLELPPPEPPDTCPAD